ncbi:OmpA family protein [Phaeodactylibacter luteus]|uniref:OmpA family protein n=1 Tax=Phaeodactylibacter luteus TaxID=1564516 RepID=A0A5C6RVV1_9BACT|nr:OmpA family protein [Phaeodactylibacter luteus]TXB66333.1 OmpA family protein [Phaeodactylibacter luteus]
MNRLLLATFLASFLSLALPSSAQPTAKAIAIEQYQAGEAALIAGKAEQALRHFRRALKADPGLSAARRGAGVCHELLRQYREAAEAYTTVLSSDSLFSRALYFEAGQVLYKSGQPEEAIHYFKKFKALQEQGLFTLSLNTEKELARETAYLSKLPASIKACEVSIDSVKFINITEVENVGNGINTQADDYFPFLTNDQKRLYFTRKTENGDEDLYESLWEGQAWSRPRPVKDLNTRTDEGMSTLVRDGRRLFYTVCGREGVLGSCDLWEVELDADAAVSTMGPVKGFVNSGRWESQAAISCDGRTLYFASNREGGAGGTDIWAAHRQDDGTWGDAKNLGAKINTDLDEEAPYITNDGQTLYFASNGHPGLGDQDIFMSWREPDGSWAAPINLGPPVNSAFRELGFYLTADGQTGYFASDRPESNLGGLDIYRFRLDSQLFSKPMTFVEGFVIDHALDMTTRATVEIEGWPNVTVGQDGRFFLCVPAGDTLYTRVDKKFFHPYQNQFIIPKWDNRQYYTIELLLQSTFDTPELAPEAVPDTLRELAVKGPRKTPKVYTQALYFGFDESKIVPDEQEKLLRFLEPIKKKEVQDIKIVGFSDDVGTDVYNLKLSEERAKAIALVIMNEGLEVDHFYMEGKGSVKDDRPKEFNRRVEIQITVLEK